MNNYHKISNYDKIQKKKISKNNLQIAKRSKEAKKKKNPQRNHAARVQRGVSRCYFRAEEEGARGRGVAPRKYIPITVGKETEHEGKRSAGKADRRTTPCSDLQSRCEREPRRHYSSLPRGFDNYDFYFRARHC